MAWETHETPEFDEWFDVMSEENQIQVIAAQTYLEDVGPAAKFPMSYPIQQANRCGMRELRPGSSGRSELRILYAFDYRRKCVFLLGGNKAEIADDWSRWYDRNVPLADIIFEREEAEARRIDALKQDAKFNKKPKGKQRRGR